MTDAADAPDAADATDPPATVAGAVRAVRGRLAAAVLLQAAASASGLVAVVAVAEIGRAAVADPGGPPAWGGVMLAVVAGIAGLLLAASADTLTHLADADLQLDLRRLVVARLGLVPLAWFDDHDAGEVRQAVQQDVAALHALVAHTLLDDTRLVVVTVASLVYLLALDVPLALACLLPLVAGVVLFARAMAGAMSSMAEYGRASAEIAGSVVEFADGIQVVRSFGRPGRAHSRYLRAVDAFAAFFGAWVARTTAATTASWLTVSPIGVLALVVPVGGAMVASGARRGPRPLPPARARDGGPRGRHRPARAGHPGRGRRGEGRRRGAARARPSRTSPSPANPTPATSPASCSAASASPTTASATRSATSTSRCPRDP